MVDYFYHGYESNNIPAGIKILEPYLDDPACLTSRKMEIERRLKGWKQLLAREGIRSKSASDYFILATPVMVLLDAKTRTILAMPDTVEELMNVILK